MDRPFVNLQPYENSFEEIAKCSETRPCCGHTPSLLQEGDTTYVSIISYIATVTRNPSTHIRSII